MKTTIYYFTGTGNSLATARRLAKNLGEDCELQGIAGLVNQDKITPGAYRLGIVFPIYFMGLPKIVEDFVSKLDLSKTKYTFGVVTIGNPISNTKMVLNQLKTTLEKNGNTLDAGYNVRFVDNYSVMLKIPPMEKQLVINESAMKKVDTIGLKVLAEEKGIENGNPLLSWFIGGMYKKWRKNLPEVNKKFYVLDSCNSCKICEKICPVANISFNNEKPSWNGNCQECLACLHFCPQNAIHRNKKTESNPQYKFAGTSTADIINQKR